MYINDKYVLCDIDGTIAQMSDRGPFEFNKVHTDLPILPIIEIIKYFYQQPNCTVIFLSGRKSYSYSKTYQWLCKYILDLDISSRNTKSDDKLILLMRSDTDNRCDTVVKKEIYEQSILSNTFYELIPDEYLENSLDYCIQFNTFLESPHFKNIYTQYKYNPLFL
mgnify:CR=1 FL=1